MTELRFERVFLRRRVRGRLRVLRPLRNVRSGWDVVETDADFARYMDQGGVSVDCGPAPRGWNR